MREGVKTMAYKFRSEQVHSLARCLSQVKG